MWHLMRTTETNGITGLNKLKGFDVTEFHILLTPKNGRNMNGIVYIPNPSVMTIDMVSRRTKLQVNRIYLI